MINCQRKILTILKYNKHNTIWCLCRLRAVCQSSVTWLRRWSARPVGPPCWRLDSHRTITTWPTTVPTVQVWVSTISYVSCFLWHLVVNTVKNLWLQLTKKKDSCSSIICKFSTTFHSVNSGNWEWLYSSSKLYFDKPVIDPWPLTPVGDMAPGTSSSYMMPSNYDMDIYGEAPDRMTYTEQANKRAHCKRLTWWVNSGVAIYKNKEG